jgi:hypothetical protein
MVVSQVNMVLALQSKIWILAANIVGLPSNQQTLGISVNIGMQSAKMVSQKLGLDWDLPLFSSRKIRN